MKTPSRQTRGQIRSESCPLSSLLLVLYSPVPLRSLLYICLFYTILLFLLLFLTYSFLPSTVLNPSLICYSPMTPNFLLYFPSFYESPYFTPLFLFSGLLFLPHFLSSTLLTNDSPSLSSPSCTLFFCASFSFPPVGFSILKSLPIYLLLILCFLCLLFLFSTFISSTSLLNLSAACTLYSLTYLSSPPLPFSCVRIPPFYNLVSSHSLPFVYFVALLSFFPY